MAKCSISYILLIKAAKEDLKINNMNIDIVFLNSELLIDTKISIEILQYFEKAFPEIKYIKNVYLKFNKSLYNLKQVFKVS